MANMEYAGNRGDYLPRLSESNGGMKILKIRESVAKRTETGPQPLVRERHALTRSFASPHPTVSWAADAAKRAKANKLPGRNKRMSLIVPKRDTPVFGDFEL